ncbi:slc16a12 [Symbiodinium sp. CCMP2592]|nr:slc16a12 [Symbiodinium sp. CCMP2592]CAE7293658.1 slc16a12 [Symbiodinium sp. CCMP2592]
MTSTKQDFIEEVRRAGRERGDSVPIYNEHACKYNEMYNGVRWQGPAHVAFSAASLLKDFPEVLSHVLDFGCGTGLTGLQLRARGISKVHGLDPSTGMRAMIPEGTYVHMYQDVADLSSLSSRFAMIVSTAVVAKLALSHLEPRGHMVFTLKVSYFNSPEFFEMFETLRMSGFAVQRSAGILLHTDDPRNEHTIVTISDQTEPRPTIMLWSTPRSMSTALKRCVQDHPQVGTVMHDIMSGPEFGLTDPEIQGTHFDGKTAATNEQEHLEWVIPSVYARLDESVQLAKYQLCYDSLASIIEAVGGPKPIVVQAAGLRSSPTKVRTFLSNLTGLNVTELSLTWPHDSPLWYRMGGGGNKSARVGTDGFRNYRHRS